MNSRFQMGTRAQVCEQTNERSILSKSLFVRASQYHDIVNSLIPNLYMVIVIALILYVCS